MAIQTRNDASATNRRQFKIFVLIALAWVFASIQMFYVTDYGLGVSPDSISYIDAARNLLAGDGFFARSKPLVHWPPVYPLLLAGVGLFQQGDILQAGRVLAIFCFGANVVLLGLAVQMCTRHSLSATGCAILIFLSSPPVIAIHAMAWSEAPFIMFLLATFVLLASHIRHLTPPPPAPPRPYLLLLASMMAGLAMTTRYVGITLLPPTLFALLYLGDQPVKYKIKDAIIFMNVASLPLAIWLIRNILIAQTATNRSFAIHPINFAHLKAFVDTMHDFVLPISLSFWIKGFYLGVVTVLFMIGFIILYKKNYIRRNVKSIHIVLPALCILFSLTYITFLGISISFFDAHTPFSSRILLPVFIALIVTGISFAWSLTRAFAQRYIWYSFIFFALCSISLNSIQAVSVAVSIHENGQGYTSQYWQHSQTVSYLANARDVRKIYSNVPEVIQFLTGKEAVRLPVKISPATHLLNPTYEEELRQIFEQCKEGKVLVVYFYGITWRGYLPSIEELEARENLPVLKRFEDGVVYATMMPATGRQWSFQVATNLIFATLISPQPIGEMVKVWMGLLGPKK